jgi:DNA-binding transcriptional ArsR family regulator
VLNYSADTVDRTFAALADPTRRSMVERLAQGPASVSDLAAPFALTLAAIMQHLTVLEAAGLVRSEKRGRVRTCELDAEGLVDLDRWLAARRATWEQRLDRLGVLLDGEPPAQPVAPRHPEHTEPSPKEH